MTIQPAFWPFDRFNSTLATTPSPRRTRIIVPIASATYVDITAGLRQRGQEKSGDTIVDGSVRRQIRDGVVPSAGCRVPRAVPGRYRVPGSDLDCVPT